MKQKIDALVAHDPYLQEFLTWANQKPKHVEPESKPMTGRTFYLALTRLPDLLPHLALVCILNQSEFLDAALDDLLKESMLKEGQDFEYVHACGDSLNNILGIVLDLGFHKSLQQLSDQLPNSDRNQASFENWCSHNYAAWVERLQYAIASHRDSSNQWEFNPIQKQLLQRYYDANQLLLDCLNTNCEVTACIREEIEATLLLPQKELEKREWA